MDEVLTEWLQDDRYGWRRPLSGLEHYEYICSSKWPNEHNIILSALLDVKDSRGKSSIDKRMLIAWAKTICTVPALTFCVVEDENGIFATYSDVIEEQELRDLVDATITFHDRFLDYFSEEQCWQSLDELRQCISQDGVSKDVGVAAALDVVCYHSKQNANSQTELHTIGLTLCVDHAAMDGVGVYCCLDKLLSHFAKITGQEATCVLQKVHPPPPLAHYLIPTLDKEDQDAAIEEQLMLLEQLDESLPGPPLHELPSHPCTSSQMRYTFSVEETQKLLSAIKGLRLELDMPELTISQMAIASHLIPMMRRFPHSGATQLAYSTAINVREPLQIPFPHYSNSTAAFTALYDVQEWDDKLDEFLLLSDRSIQYIQSLAVTITRVTAMHRAKCRELANVYDKLLMALVNDFSSVDYPSRHTPLCMSDGTTERYLKQRYSGDSITVDVLSAHMGTHVHQPYMIARSATFRDKLTISLDYNEEIYKGQEVQEMVEEWAATLQQSILGARDIAET